MNNKELNERLTRIRGLPVTYQPTYNTLEETLQKIRDHFTERNQRAKGKNIKRGRSW